MRANGRIAAFPELNLELFPYQSMPSCLNPLYTSTSPTMSAKVARQVALIDFLEKLVFDIHNPVGTIGSRFAHSGTGSFGPGIPGGPTAPTVPSFDYGRGESFARAFRDLPRIHSNLVVIRSDFDTALLRYSGGDLTTHIPLIKKEINSLQIEPYLSGMVSMSSTLADDVERLGQFIEENKSTLGYDRYSVGRLSLTPSEIANVLKAYASALRETKVRHDKLKSQVAAL